MSPLKEAVIKMIEDLPDECTVEDIHYHLYVIGKVFDGRKAIDEGRVVPHAEVRRRFAICQESTGPSPR